MHKEVSFALVGCGRIAERHSQLLASGAIKHAKLVAVCDIDEERARFLGTKYNVPYFTSYDVMCETVESIQAISILTPSGLHAQHCIALAKKGKHIIVEKPMALTLDDADRMIQACENYGVKLFVVKQNRYNLPVQKLFETFAKGRFGKLVMGTVRVRWCRQQAYYDQDAWRGTWKMDGGVFSNQASHHIDLLEWFMGDVESLFAKSATQLVNIEVEDTGIVMLKFKNGALGVIEATTATRPQDIEGSISILGEKGSVEIGGFAVNEIKHWKFEVMTQEDMEIKEKFSTNPPNVYGFGHQRYYDDVVESILHEKAIVIDGKEGRKSLELITAIYASIETGKEIFLTQNHTLNCKLGH